MAQLSQETRNSIRELRGKGVSITEVMTKLNVGETAVLKYQNLAEDLTPEAEHRLARELRESKKLLKEALERNVLNSAFEQFIEQVVNVPVHIPKWTREVCAGAKAIPTIHFSDQHYDENIDPKEINWVNGYDRPTALGRTKRLFTNALELSRDYLHNLDYPGVVLTMGGDTFSGNIHDELKMTNAGSICESVLYWLEPVAAGIKLLADDFGSVYIPCVVGNHPRNTMKPIHKGRVRDNMDWLFYNLLKREFLNDDRVTFDISESPDIQYSLYDTRYLLTHGDQFKGGAGMAGMFPPMLLGHAKKQRRQFAVSSPYDVMLSCHFHSLAFMANKVVLNGSLKGYDEYASNLNLDFEEAQQAFFLTDPKYGMTITAPIHVVGEDEAWRKKKRPYRELRRA